MRRAAAWQRRGLVVALAFLAAAPAFAVERVLEVTAPAAAEPGERIEVSVSASTDAGAGERIGFLHVEYSQDDGRTWTGICYEQNISSTETRQFNIIVGPAGSKTLVRARAAFRDGVAGNVDYSGAAIQWQDSWAKWGRPPARWTETVVTAR
jgi:hypothetical protein